MAKRRDGERRGRRTKTRKAARAEDAEGRKKRRGGELYS